MFIAYGRTLGTWSCRADRSTIDYVLLLTLLLLLFFCALLLSFYITMCTASIGIFHPLFSSFPLLRVCVFHFPWKIFIFFIFFNKKLLFTETQRFSDSLVFASIDTKYSFHSEGYEQSSLASPVLESLSPMLKRGLGVKCLIILEVMPPFSPSSIKLSQFS